MMKRTDASTGAIERLWILWTGFRDGADYANHHPETAAYLDADHVVAAAAIACERSGHANLALDRALVHPAYTHGWMAGYLAAQRGLEHFADAPQFTEAIPVMDS